MSRLEKDYESMSKPDLIKEIRRLLTDNERLRRASRNSLPPQKLSALVSEDEFDSALDFIDSLEEKNPLFIDEKKSNKTGEVDLNALKKLFVIYAFFKQFGNKNAAGKQKFKEEVVGLSVSGDEAAQRKEATSFPPNKTCPPLFCG